MNEIEQLHIKVRDLEWTQKIMISYLQKLIKRVIKMEKKPDWMNTKPLPKIEGNTICANCIHSKECAEGHPPYYADFEIDENGGQFCPAYKASDHHE